MVERKGLFCPLDDEMTDQWIEEFLFPEKALEFSGRQLIDLSMFIKNWRNHEYEADAERRSIKQLFAFEENQGRFRKLIGQVQRLSSLILKDKASVEGSVGAISTWIIATLRYSHCFSINELNEEA